MIMVFLGLVGAIVGISSLYDMVHPILAIVCWIPFYVWVIGVPVYHIMYNVKWTD